MSRRVSALPGILLSAAVALAGCATAPPTRPPASDGPPGPSSPPSAGGSGETGPLSQPGQPYTGEALLEAMRSSRRPGGVAPELQTAPVADALAELLWSVDGAPPDDMALSGTCGDTSCTLELVAVRDDADGEDIWRFSVDPETGAVTVVDAELGAVPGPVREALDRAAREGAPSALLDELFLASARWSPPPSAGVFELRYRSGDEEESCMVDLAFDVETRRVVDVAETGC